MQAAHIAARRLSLSCLGIVPAAVVVALSIQACSAEVPNNTTPTPYGTSLNPTDPSCRPVTCTTLGKNCGTMNDGCGGTLRCGTCAVGTNGFSNDCRDNVCSQGCTSNAQCPGSACINGSCTDKCADSSNCPSGQYCNNGSCAANASTTCRYDSECRADERCTNNVCQGLNSSGGYPNGTNRACRSDSECYGGESCRNSVCTSLGARTCRYHSDCSPSESCTNGYCSSQGGYSCSNDTQCGYGESCLYGICRQNNGNNYGGVYAMCNTRQLSIPIIPGWIGVGVGNSENWLNEGNNPAVRVDSCTCPPNDTRMLIQDQWGTRYINCSHCIKNGDERTCYQ
jgi:hypothetical protein